MTVQEHTSAVAGPAGEPAFVNRRDPARRLGPDGNPAVSRRAAIWADVPDEKWNDWRWQLSNRVNELSEIEAILNLTDDERECRGQRGTIGLGRIVPALQDGSPRQVDRRPCVWIAQQDHVVAAALVHESVGGQA